MWLGGGVFGGWWVVVLTFVFNQRSLVLLRDSRCCAQLYHQLQTDPLTTASGCFKLLWYSDLQLVICKFERCRLTFEGHLKFSWTQGYDHKRNWDGRKTLCSSESGCKDFVLFIYPLMVSVTNEKSNWSSKTQHSAQRSSEKWGFLCNFLSSWEIAILQSYLEKCNNANNNQTSCWILNRCGFAMCTTF